ncbi:MAG: hypothetical protein HC895_17865 [Leptolyngbyaceae cyanobacterium SM1_3_5]|nr:hypothetical protein [Leptolyngbyaceae cyanobacterium SM1_3_5]
MTSNSPTPDRPAFNTPNPDELQSEETREVLHDRYADQPEADLSNVDRISQGESNDANALISDDESATPVDLQMGIVARSAD